MRTTFSTLTQLLLASDRTIGLTDLRFCATYGGIPPGYPCKPVNDLRIESLLRHAELAHPTAPVHLLPPPREHPALYSGASGPVEVLPPIACTGTFHSAPLDPSHDPSLYRSTLTIVWFQHTPTLPTATGTDPPLHTVPWDHLARDRRL
ncbi:hypothetical protein [Streptomyces mangrovisoli]|uniref:hypothetical protein n=1 Tax=Streptomyces mangrovisoli TaxID=1428628 RepID=UPI0030B804E0